MKKIILYTLGIGLVIIIGLLISYGIVSWNASGRTYDDVNEIPHNKVGLLLATSPITPGGAHNYYFENRIKSTDELYKAGKIDYIIASGGDYTKGHKFGCDEPQAIKDSLVTRGIPEDKIILDYDGTRTLNSIVKAKYGYSWDSVTLISQKYHNERAIYLADKYGLHAIGFNAEPSPIRRNRIKNTVREIFARPKMFIDLISGFKPKLGFPSSINNAEIDSLCQVLSEISYKDDELSNFEKVLKLDRKAEIILKIDSILLIQHYFQQKNINNEIQLWKKLTRDINAFIDCKMIEKWETGYIGTAGSSIEGRVNLDLAIAHAVYTESLENDNKDLRIIDSYNLLSESHLSSDYNSKKTIDQIIIEINNYLENYLEKGQFLDDFWHNEFSYYDEWISETTLQVYELKNILLTYSDLIQQKSLYNENITIIFNSWLFQKIFEILKYGDK